MFTNYSIGNSLDSPKTQTPPSIKQLEERRVSSEHGAEQPTASSYSV